MRRSALTIIEVLFAVLAVTQVSTFHAKGNSRQACSAMQVPASQLDDLGR
jgi:hypothetical protein